MSDFSAHLAHWLEQAGAPFLTAQRWFGDKGRATAATRVRDLAIWNSEGAPHAALALVEIESAEAPGAPASSALYQVPLVVEAGAGPAPAAPIARVQWNGEALALLEGFADAHFRRRLLRLICAAAILPTDRGRIEFGTLATFSDEGALAHIAEAGSSEAAGVEQSNSSALYLDEHRVPRYILKLFRRLQPGINPELEITAALAEHTRYHAVPRTIGQASYFVGEEETTLAVLQEFTPNQGNVWEFLLRQLRERLAADVPPEHIFIDEIALLGRRTAELHIALATVPGEAFRPEPITAADREAWQTALTRQARAAGAELKAALPRLPHSIAAAAERLSARLQTAAMGALDALAGVEKTRIHGDFHLGQVLKTADDFCILDFEGEPARPIAERRRKHCVLKDVAGMLRSFSYAAHMAAAGDAAKAWEQAARGAFWSGYRGIMNAEAQTLLPSEEEACRQALDFFEREKAVYELDYELHHRPNWVEVPVSGLARLLG